MNVFFIALSCVFVIYFIYAALLVFLNDKDSGHGTEADALPFVSVLVAARNEEKNIERCMQALIELDYPKDRIEFLIGDDQSMDLTSMFVKAFEQKDARIRLVRIKADLGSARGKANVLAHLAREAKGEFLFITDADIKVPKTWVKGLLKKFNKDIAIVSGSTAIDGQSLIAKLQNIEWIYAFGMVNMVSSWGVPVSAVGNNMAIRKEAYDQTGGYENIPFSVTEDLALFKVVVKNGWKFVNFASADTLGSSKEQPDYASLLKQRRRWMAGAMGLPLVLFVFLFLQQIYIPLWLTMFFFSWKIAVGIMVLKLVLEALFIQKQWKRCGRTDSWLHLFLPYQLYTGLFALVLGVYYIFTPKVTWKGRKFDGK